MKVQVRWIRFQVQARKVMYLLVMIVIMMKQRKLMLHAFDVRSCVFRLGPTELFYRSSQITDRALLPLQFEKLQCGVSNERGDSSCSLGIRPGHPGDSARCWHGNSKGSPSAVMRDPKSENVTEDVGAQKESLEPSRPEVKYRPSEIGSSHIDSGLL